MKNKQYLLDSNSFIAPYKTYYSFDIAEVFWKQLRARIDEKQLLVLDLVKAEVVKGEDELSQWIKDIDDTLVIKRKDLAIIQRYREILDYVQRCGYYNEKALRDWAEANVADPWLIATASVFGYVIVTQEKSSGNLSTKNQQKKALIPDVCEHFGVECRDLFYMMREVGFKL